MDKIYFAIHANQDILGSFTQDTYPELARIRRKTSVITHLYDLMEYMLTYSEPAWRRTNRCYFLFSEKHLTDWNKSRGGTGDVTTWQSHKIFLLHAGLIKTHVVIGEQKDPVLRRIWTTAVANGHRSETLWSVPLYTPEVLRRAEWIARQYRENHVNLTHIRKNVIVRIWGQYVANSLYRSSRHEISERERLVEICIREVMRTTVRQKGFTTVEELQQCAVVLCMSRQYGTEQQIIETIKKLMDQKRMLIYSAGYEFHPIRKEDRIFAIPKEYNGYIITEIKNE